MLVVLTSVGIMLAFSPAAAPIVAIPWGVLLLGAITHRVARRRGVSPWRETLKHAFVALIVIVVSRVVGGWIAAHVH